MPGRKELFLDGMLGRLESAKTIRDRLAEAGLCLQKMQDVSGNIGGVDRAAESSMEIWNPSVRHWGRNGRF